MAERVCLAKGVRADNPVRGSDQQSCASLRLAVMITDHVPAVRLPPDHAGRLVAAAVPAGGGVEDRRDLAPAPPARHSARAPAPPRPPRMRLPSLRARARPGMAPQRMETVPTAAPLTPPSLSGPPGTTLLEGRRTRNHGQCRLVTQRGFCARPPASPPRPLMCLTAGTPPPRWPRQTSSGGRIVSHGRTCALLC